MKNILALIAGIFLGVYLERYTTLFDDLNFGPTPDSDPSEDDNLKDIDAQVRKGEGITNEAATGNND